MPVLRRASLLGDYVEKTLRVCEDLHSHFEAKDGGQLDGKCSRDIEQIGERDNLAGHGGPNDAFRLVRFKMNWYGVARVNAEENDVSKLSREVCIVRE